jgi:hypothetical protein
MSCLDGMDPSRAVHPCTSRLAPDPPCAPAPPASRHAPLHPAPRTVAPDPPRTTCALRLAPRATRCLRLALRSPMPALTFIGRQQVDEHVLQPYVSCILDVCYMCFILML